MNGIPNAAFTKANIGEQNLDNGWQVYHYKVGSVPSPIHMTLQLRLTIWYTALLGVTLILFSLLVYYALDATLYSKVQSGAIEQAQRIKEIVGAQLVASNSVSTLVPRSTEGGDISITLQLIEIPNVNVFVGVGDVQFFDIETGRIFRSSEKLYGQQVPVQLTALKNISKEGNDYAQPIVYQGRPLAIYSDHLVVGSQERLIGVQIIQSLAPVANTLAQIRQLLILGTICSLALAALVGAYLARRSLRPLTTITETASGITETDDLGQRLSIPDETSEVGQLAKTFNQMLNRIQQLFKTQEQLIADVSHELRTPLTTIQGNIDLLQRFIKQANHYKKSDVSSSERTKHDRDAGDAKSSSSISEENDRATETVIEMLSEVEDEANRMGRMISDLLLLAQADSGELTLQTEPVEMDTLLLEVFRQTQRLAVRAKGVDGLVVRLGKEDQALVLGDRERLRQLLLNLTGNAVKYTPIGGTITLSLETSNEWMQIRVKDTGIGISQENQELIFGRFYRTDKARSREMGGSGLGLSISQWIAHAHGGKISVESEMQVGSEFILWLPLHKQ